MGKWDDYMRSEGFKEYYVIDAFQLPLTEEERTKMIQEIEACKTPDEAKAIVAKARGIA